MEHRRKVLATTYSQVEGACVNRLVDIVDRFSTLPNELQHQILSFVDFKCLTRVGSVSRKCRQLYFSTPSLNVWLWDVKPEHQLKLLQEFELFLNRRGDIKIQLLSFSFNVPKRNYDRLLPVIKRISTAGGCNVERLDLRFHVYGRWSPTMEFPSFIFGSLRSLSLNWFNSFLKVPSVSSCYLVSLNLERVKIEDMFCKWISCSCKCIKELLFKEVTVENMVIESSSLESFKLVFCHCNDLSHLNISGAKLVNIHIEWGNSITARTSITMLAPNVKHLTWIGKLCNHYNLGRLMCLEKAEIFLKRQEDNYDFSEVSEFLCSIRKAKVLILGEETIKALFREGSMHATLDDVSYLSLHIEALGDVQVPLIVSLLRGMCNLTTLHINSYQGIKSFNGKPKSRGCNRKYWKSQNLGFIDQLKEVKIELSNGYNGMEFACYILEHAQNMKKMVISYLPHQSYVATKVNKTRRVSDPVVLLQEKIDCDEEYRRKFNSKYRRYLLQCKES